jgi:hypothetical protein
VLTVRLDHSTGAGNGNVSLLRCSVETCWSQQALATVPLGYLDLWQIWWLSISLVYGRTDPLVASASRMQRSL